MTTKWFKLFGKRYGLLNFLISNKEIRTHLNEELASKYMGKIIVREEYIRIFKKYSDLYNSKDELNAFMS